MALVPPSYPWYAFGARSFGSMVVSWCPGLGGVNAGTLKPVGWESIVYVKKKQGRCIYGTADKSEITSGM
jgi:hypothetical protein